jgi:indolepyruvate ferredoxin oxidoreductase alpha subunit
MAHGMDKAGEPKQVVGILGDSTFFHSGITPLLDIGYNKGCSTIIVVDNRTTAMTGHQEHPGSGRTLMGEETVAASVQEIGKACGIKRIKTINPYDQETTQQVVSEEIQTKEASLIVSSAPCPLRQKKRVGAVRRIDTTLCKNCRRCLKLGCPAIDGAGEKPQIMDFLCNGCGLCEQVCPFDAIQEVKE